MTITQRVKPSVKGKAFEDQVADLFRLLGADVTQNISVCNKKVDILTVLPLPGTSLTHRTLVECKDERRAVAQNQRLMQLKGLLDLARQTDQADTAEIITRVPWGDEAKAFARRSSIALMTYAEKVGSLIDFKPYLADLIAAFSATPGRQGEPPLAKYYVTPSLERLTPTGSERINFERHFSNWLTHGGSRYQIAVLSGYGTGKTSLCSKIACDLAEAYLKNPGHGRVPILLDLREFTKTISIEAFISAFLEAKCASRNPQFRLFNKMNEAGTFLVICDGFDEMAARVNADTLEQNIYELERLVGHPNSRLLITSREEYFISHAEQTRLFRPRGVQHRELDVRTTEYEGLRIALWTEREISEFLSKRVPLTPNATRSWTYYQEQIQNIPGLRDLARRPVLLEMIVKTLPALVEAKGAIDRPYLYEKYLMGELNRQKITKKRTLLMPDEVRLRLLKRLALDFYTRSTPAITFTESQEVVKELKPPASELESYVRDFLTCSFLVREGEQYHFSHKSIMEYLAASALVPRQGIEELKNLWVRHALTIGVADFIVEMKANREILRHWLNDGKYDDGVEYLSGNAATVLVRANRDALREADLRDVNLRGADLRFADLRRARFDGARIRDANFEGAQFRKAQLTAARVVRDVSVTIAVVGSSKAVDAPANWVGEIAGKTSFAGVQVEWAKASEPVHGWVVGVIKAKVADLERLAWVEDRIAKQPHVKFRAIYAEELERLRKSYGAKVASQVTRLHELFS